MKTILFTMFLLSSVSALANTVLIEDPRDLKVQDSYRYGTEGEGPVFMMFSFSSSASGVCKRLGYKDAVKGSKLAPTFRHPTYPWNVKHTTVNTLVVDSDGEIKRVDIEKPFISSIVCVE